MASDEERTRPDPWGVGGPLDAGTDVLLRGGTLTEAMSAVVDGWGRGTPPLPATVREILPRLRDAGVLDPPRLPASRPGRASLH